jgi:hypothetical protein
MCDSNEEARSWRPDEEEETPKTPLDELMRELQRRRDMRRKWRAFTRDYLNRLG